MLSFIIAFLLSSRPTYDSLNEDMICCRIIQQYLNTHSTTPCKGEAILKSVETNTKRVEEKELQGAMMEAQHFLVKKYAGFVGSIVKSLGVPRGKYPQGGRSAYFELYADGICGLLLAARRYDVSKGYLLSTFAKMYIVDAVHRGKTRLLPGNLLSHYHVMARHRIRKMRFLLQEDLRRSPTVEEIAERLPYSEGMIRRLLISDVGKWKTIP